MILYTGIKGYSNIIQIIDTIKEHKTLDSNSIVGNNSSNKYRRILRSGPWIPKITIVFLPITPPHFYK